MLDHKEKDERTTPAPLSRFRFVQISIWQSRRARRNLRKMLVSVWRKRYDPSSGYYFYENTITGENVWEAPPVFKRFFPDIDW